MRKVIKVVSLAALLTIMPSCDVVDSYLQESGTNTSGSSSSGLSNSEVVAGLKEALTEGIRNAVDVTSVTDGFLKNEEIKLPFPESAIKVKEKAIEWGLEGQVDKIVTTLNRAAEDAAKSATPIFIDAIKNMSIQDGFEILRGGEGKATEFLRKNTTDQLIAAFSPKVQESIERVKLTEYWEPVATRYNQAMVFTGGQKVDTDLNRYVTERAIDGLFDMVEKEENKIRKDPAARVTDLLSKVFGSIN